MSNWVTNDHGKSYELKKDKGIRITLHHYIGCGNTWFVSCHDLHIDRHEIGDIPLEQAQNKAYDFVKNKAKELYDTIISLGE